MLRKSFKVIFVVLFIFVFSSVALALSPQDALSSRSDKSLYTVLCVEDLNGLLQEVFSEANLALVAPLLDPNDAPTVSLVASFVSQIPAKKVIIAAGLADSVPFLPFIQVAASMPASVRPKLNKVADGSATGVDIITLLLGDAAMMFAGAVEPEVHKGAKGPYYTLFDAVAFTAKDDLLLIASSPKELEASLEALEKNDKRLALKRRFDSPSFWKAHIDYPTALAFAEFVEVDTESPFGDLKDIAKAFKAPLEFEFGLTAKPGSYLLSIAVNALESLANSAHLKDVKPEKGAGMFMAGGGKLLFALSSPTAFNPENFKDQPEFAEAWNQLVSGLAMVSITDGDLVDMLNGSISLALGSDATVMGMKIPGGYISITGKEGTAAKILGKLMANELFTQSAPLVPLKADGWDSAFGLDPAAVPMPVFFGVNKDTLFLGIVDSGSITVKPEFPAEVSKLLNNPLFGLSFIDTAAIWNYVKKEAANPDSLLSSTIDENAKAVLNEFLDVDLSVSLVKLWSTEVEAGFMEFSVVDVPEGKQLLPRLLKIIKMFNP